MQKERAYPLPPGNLYGYQSKGVAEFDCYKLLKTSKKV